MSESWEQGLLLLQPALLDGACQTSGICKKMRVDEAVPQPVLVERIFAQMASDVREVWSFAHLYQDGSPGGGMGDIEVAREGRLLALWQRLRLQS
jgi:hypothetical protein